MPQLRPAHALLADHAGEDPFQLHEDPEMIDLRASFYITGVLHVMDNIVKGLPQALGEYYSTFVTQLAAVTRFLCNKWQRDEMLQACYQQHPQRLFVDSVSSFSNPVYEGQPKENSREARVWVGEQPQHSRLSWLVHLSIAAPLLEVKAQAWSSGLFLSVFVIPKLAIP